MKKRITFKYKKIVKEIVNKSFPLLKNRRFYVIRFKSKNYSGGAFWLLPFLRLIFITKRKFTNKQFVGLISHELSHFEIFQKRGWLISIFITICYWLYPGFRRKEEIKADKLAIRKGYAKELFLFRKNQSKKLISNYLSLKQIKSYAKEIRDGN
jgi:hypothetical protein